MDDDWRGRATVCLISIFASHSEHPDGDGCKDQKSLQNDREEGCEAHPTEGGHLLGLEEAQDALLFSIGLGVGNDCGG